MLAKLSLNVVGAIYATNHSMSFLRLSSSMHCTVLYWTVLYWTVINRKCFKYLSTMGNSIFIGHHSRTDFI